MRVRRSQQTQQRCRPGDTWFLTRLPAECGQRRSIKAGSLNMVETRTTPLLRVALPGAG
jgi:hypothetical protein